MGNLKHWIVAAAFVFIGGASWAQTPVPQPDHCAAVRAALRQDGADSTALVAYDNDELLTCFRKGGKAMMLVDDTDAEIWGVSENGTKDDGWIAVFNKSDEAETVFVVSHEEMGLQTCPGNYALIDVLGGGGLHMGQEVTVRPKGVLFIRYRSLD